MNPKQQLSCGVQQLGLGITDTQLHSLLQFVALLKKWNKTYNLTAIKDTPGIISKHLLDSLSVSKHLVGERILDVGSGAGLPGLPLAITHREKYFTLLDSNIKKTRFLQQAVIMLKLQNVQVVHQRVQAYRVPAQRRPDTVVSRAFANSNTFFRQCDHLITQGRLIFMLGKQKQLEAVPKSYNVLKICSVTIRQLNGQRHIGVLEKTA